MVTMNLEQLKALILAQGWTWSCKTVYCSKDKFGYQAVVIGAWGKSYASDEAGSLYTSEQAALQAAFNAAKAEADKIKMKE